MAERVELGIDTMRALAAMIGEAVKEALDQTIIPPERAVDIDYISPVAAEAIKMAVYDALAERD